MWGGFWRPPFTMVAFDASKKKFVQFLVGVGGVFDPLRQAVGAVVGADASKQRQFVCATSWFFSALSFCFVILLAVGGAFVHHHLIFALLGLGCVAFVVPWIHRYNDILGVLVLTLSQFAVFFYVVSEVGRHSGFQLFFIGIGITSFLTVGRRGPLLNFAIILFSVIFGGFAWSEFPAEAAPVQLEEGLLAWTYFLSLAGTVVISVYSVYQAFGTAQFVTLPKARDYSAKGEEASPTALDSEELTFFQRFLRKTRVFINELTLAGTEGYPPETRQRLRITNIAGYLIAGATINYFLLHVAFDMLDHWQIVLGNLVLVPIALSAPFVHRFHDHAAISILLVSEFVMMFYLISLMGRDAGVQINYIGFAAGAFLAIDRSRPRLILAVIAAAFALSTLAWFLFPPEKASIQLSTEILDNMYVNSMLGTVGIVAFIVYYAFQLVHSAKAETDQLLRNILPESIADRLKEKPDETIADSCSEASVLFADLVGFTPTARKLGASKIVMLLNEIFTRFDKIASDLEVEKIKTIGDAYMVVSGLPYPQDDHAERLAVMGLRMQKELDVIAREQDLEIGLRIGIETGPVMAGVIGRTKFFYDVWGDTVNMASRLESHGVCGEVHVSSTFISKLGERFEVERRGIVDIKGVGETETWFLRSIEDE